ncbi:uncharacterized protein K452DRAFT_120255 [Aplosporella prunicola CBS 121167]|uniref:Uncharacterized protein n=1 Tax=Aplosporella prunicola CBS 121167 TaxID=1176127 RepID=A0A6A6BQ86_9PEZI|nr:uncharacterized protein K452DRAFT_120255 [Aplosporella prunicola CBS 121167]KAF2145465.1 hypothetical protein K452DRAFT_120255 [Aplosporella prunicola CBS 121167]
MNVCVRRRKTKGEGVERQAARLGTVPYGTSVSDQPHPPNLTRTQTSRLHHAPARCLALSYPILSYPTYARPAPISFPFLPLYTSTYPARRRNAREEEITTIPERPTTRTAELGIRRHLEARRRRAITTATATTGRFCNWFERVFLRVCCLLFYLDRRRRRRRRGRRRRLNGGRGGVYVYCIYRIRCCCGRVGIGRSRLVGY